MARDLLTTVDSVISNIEHALAIRHIIRIPTILYSDDDRDMIEWLNSQGAGPNYNSLSPILEGPFDLRDPELLEEIEKRYFDPTLWEESLRKNPSLTRDVQAKVDRGLADAKLPLEQINAMSLLEKVKSLYEIQHPESLVRRPPKPTFTTCILSRLNPDGTPRELSKQCITYDTDWLHFLKVLEEATRICNDGKGYTSRDGLWSYKLFEDKRLSGLSNSGDEGWEKLATDLDYRDMKHMLIKKQDTQVGVILRHEQNVLRSRALKADYDAAEHDDLLGAEWPWSPSNDHNPDANPLDENGYPYFEESKSFEALSDAIARHFEKLERQVKKEREDMTEEDVRAEEADRKREMERKAYWAEFDRKRAEKRKAAKKAAHKEQQKEEKEGSPRPLTQ